jgi:hypothetical protein
LPNSKRIARNEQWIAEGGNGKPCFSGPMIHGRCKRTGWLIRLETITFIPNGEGSSLEELIPSGWKILDNKTGDLNQDGFQDLAFVIQDTDPDAFSLNDGFGGDTLDLNP